MVTRGILDEMNEWQEDWQQHQGSPDWQRWERQRPKREKREQRKAQQEKLAAEKAQQRKKVKVQTSRDPRRLYIYFIQAVDGGPVKIGHAYNPNRRLKDLQVASPYKLVLRYKIPGTQQLEHYLHERFAGCRLEGEWFEVHPDMPGCLQPDGLSTADWLDDDAKIRVFERETQEQREAARAYRLRQK